MRSTSLPFAPMARSDPAALSLASYRAAAADADAALPGLDLEDRLIPLSGKEAFQIMAFTHVVYFALLESMHLRIEPVAMVFMVYATHRYAIADRAHFTRRALLAGAGSALFCIALQLALGPHHR